MLKADACFYSSICFLLSSCRLIFLDIPVEAVQSFLFIVFFIPACTARLRQA